MSDAHSIKYPVIFNREGSSGNVKLWSMLIFVQWLMYENLIFLEPERYVNVVFLVLVYSFKLLFPFALLFFWGMPRKTILNRASIAISLASFCLFTFWSLVPTMIGGSIVSWMKLLPVFVLYIGAISFFDRNPEAFVHFSKCIVCYCLTALLQYLIIVGFKIYTVPSEGSLTGPFGILGNTAARINFTDVPIFRLTGFWREPSNAAGSCFAAYYLGKYVFITERKKLWRFLSIGCLVAGVLTLSNAGYLAIGFSFLVGFILSFNKVTLKKLLQAIVLLFFTGGAIWLAIFGRTYFAEKGGDNYYLLALGGVRNLSVANSKDYDPSDGRLDMMNYALSQTRSNPIGKGLQITGASGIEAPAGAPLFWLLLTGVPGLILILLRDLPIFAGIPRKLRRNAGVGLILQAFLVVLVQQASYGSWMDANYLLYLAVLAIGFTSKAEEDICAG